MRLHEVAGAAAEMATLGVVAELGAGAEAQALVDVWGLHRGGRSWRVWVSARSLRVPPSYPGIQAGPARCGSLIDRHSRRLSPCARSGPHPRRCWRWWRSWSAWGLRRTERVPCPEPPCAQAAVLCSTAPGRAPAHPCRRGAYRCCSPPHRSRPRSRPACCSAARRTGSAGSGTETPSCLCSGGSGPWGALRKAGVSDLAIGHPTASRSTGTPCGSLTSFGGCGLNIQSPSLHLKT